MQPYLAAASVAVAPLYIGSGTRLKILEALAMGKAVVSTSLGCEGLSVALGKHLLVEDEPEEFAEAVIALLRNPARRAALASACRSLVEEQHSWGHSGAQLLRSLDELTWEGEVPYTDAPLPQVRRVDDGDHAGIPHFVSQHSRALGQLGDETPPISEV